MKILTIGDLHGNLEMVEKISLENIDLILLTGDIGKADLMRKMHFDNIERMERGEERVEYEFGEERAAFMEAYDSTVELVRYLSAETCVALIFGNVESSNVDTKRLSRKIGFDLPFLNDKLSAMEKVRVIHGNAFDFEGIKIGGLNYFVETNWVRTFRVQDYEDDMECAKIETARARRILNSLGRLDILVCHQPPFGILDLVTSPLAPESYRGKHAGSELILDYIKREKPHYVFCGHIHEAKGIVLVNGSHIYNLGCDGHKVIEF